MNQALIRIADGFSLAAEGLRELATAEGESSTANVKKKEKVQNTKNAEIKEDPAEDQEPVIRIEEIRAVLAEKSQDGKTKEVRELLQQFGVAKLSAVEVKDYLELMQKAKEL